MTKREQLLQELEQTSDDVLGSVLEFLRFINAHPINTVQQIDTLEAIIGIRKGLEEFDRGEGIPATEALENLQHRLNIPPRP
jgi:hypothetical protein